MSILVVGSVAIDSVRTPFGQARQALGGSATFFSYAASFFAPVNLVACIGRDFPAAFLKILRQRKNIDLLGLECKSGKTFRWHGAYHRDLNTAHTLKTELNVFGDFKPNIPPAYRNSRYIFLANIDPDLQAGVLASVKRPRLVVCDTMNYWINTKKKQLISTLSRVGVSVLNDAEARLLTGESNLITCAKQISRMGPHTVIIKKGEHGALLYQQKKFFYAPAYPLEKIKDPTGCGDSFGGGFLGSLARSGRLDWQSFKKAVVYGSVIASFTAEDFSLRRLQTLSRTEINKRFNEFTRLVAL